MQVGDLVAYPRLHGEESSKPLTLGIVTFAEKDGSGVTVQWANGVTMHHSTSWLIKVEAIQPSENT
jgi:hypothetical protein